MEFSEHDPSGPLLKKLMPLCNESMNLIEMFLREFLFSLTDTIDNYEYEDDLGKTKLL